MNRDAGEVGSAPLDVADVYSDPNSQLLGVEASANRLGSPQRVIDRRKRREDAVTRCLHDDTALTRDLGSYLFIVAIQGCSPTRVTHRREPIGGANQISEHDHAELSDR